MSDVYPRRILKKGNKDPALVQEPIAVRCLEAGVYNKIRAHCQKIGIDGIDTGFVDGGSLDIIHYIDPNTSLQKPDRHIVCSIVCDIGGSHGRDLVPVGSRHPGLMGRSGISGIQDQYTVIKL